MSNRSFLYGDGLFETIRVSEGQALNLAAHFERLSRGLAILQLQNPAQPFTYLQFKTIIEGFIAQQSTTNLRIRGTFFRQIGGRYTPEQQAFDYQLEATSLPTAAYPIPTQSLTIGIAQTIQLSQTILSNLKTTSALPYVMAGLEKKKEGWEDCLLLNQQGYVAEAIAANVFLKKGSLVWTPALNQGCIAGVMRQLLLQLLPQLGYRVVEGKIKVQQVLEAEEVWLTNALQGVQGVTACVGRTAPYSREIAQQLQQHLSLRAKNDRLN